MKGKKSEILYEILKKLAIGAGMFLVLSSPSGSRSFIKIVSKELGRRKEKREYLLKKFYYLRYKELIEFVEDGEKTRIVLTEKGTKRVLSYDFDKLEIRRTTHWDRKWHLIVFDIPEALKVARDALVLKLKKLGLVQFNKSVWVYPYECKDEVDFIAEFFEVGRYVHYIVADSMTNEENLRVLFDL